MPSSPHARPLFAALFLFALAALPAAASAAERVTVEVTSGRIFVGEVSPRTDVDRLWVKSGSDRTVIERPLDWSIVTSVKTGDKSFTPVEFREHVRSREWQSAHRTSARTVKLAQPEELPAPELVPTIEQTVGPCCIPMVRSLQLDACLGHWDNAVETTGIVVNAYALDEYGSIVPVRGTLDVELVGVRQGSDPVSETLAEVGRWTRAVLPEELGLYGYTFRLPFQAVHPDFVSRLDVMAIVHARLTVPGQGVFEASADVVRIRTFSPVRNQLEWRRGSRWLPNEWNNRSPNAGY